MWGSVGGTARGQEGLSPPSLCCWLLNPSLALLVTRHTSLVTALGLAHHSSLFTRHCPWPCSSLVTLHSSLPLALLVTRHSSLSPEVIEDAPHGYPQRAFFVPNPSMCPLSIVSECAVAQPQLRVDLAHLPINIRGIYITIWTEREEQVSQAWAPSRIVSRRVCELPNHLHGK
jgi:hypothetical protein